MTILCNVFIYFLYSLIKFPFLLVERLPHRPLIESIRNVTVPLGGRAVFECNYRSDPHPYLTWIKHKRINGSYYDENTNPYFDQVQVRQPAR